MHICLFITGCPFLVLQFVNIEIIETSVNPYVWASSSQHVQPPILSIELETSDGGTIDVKDLEEPISLMLPYPS